MVVLIIMENSQFCEICILNVKVAEGEASDPHDFTVEAISN